MPEPDQMKRSKAYEAPEQEAAEPKPNGPPEEKSSRIGQSFGDSPDVVGEVDSERVPSVQTNRSPETGTQPESDVSPVAPSGQQGKLRPTIEELPSEKSGPTVAERNAAVLSDSRSHTRRSFMVAAAAAAAGYGVYHWLNHLTEEEMQPEGYRKAFDANAAISRAVFDDRGLAPTYPLSKAQDLRVNGVYGLKQMLEPSSYRLQLVGSTASVSDRRYSQDVTAWKYIYVDEKTMGDQGHDTKTPPSARTAEKMAPASMLEDAKQQQDRTGRMPRGKEEAGESRSTLPVGTPGLLLTMEDILELPRHELVTQFKCIEGWSQIVHWAGVRMADFIEAYLPTLIDGKEPRYVYMETPEGDYYTGYDLHVCRHPQTLLVTEMMGAPLTQYHGAPLRLHMPIKYGYKQIKRIGLINYTNRRPDDYWTKLGYDWYAGL